LEDDQPPHHLELTRFPRTSFAAYGLDRTGKAESQIIVYDLGGGTFDVSLLSIEEGVFEVLATAGDTHLGGEDFDNRVIDHFVKEYKRKSGGTDVSGNKRAMGKLKREVEKAKRTLSNQQSVKVEIEAFENGNDFSEVGPRPVLWVSDRVVSLTFFEAIFRPSPGPSSRNSTWTCSGRP
jgi:heat shock protein 5